jgi:signal transduction histidine kinase
MPLPSQPLIAASIDEILITGELSRRPPRAADLKAESEALHTLARAISRGPQATLDALVNAAMQLCNAGAAGVSLLDISAGRPGIFRWVALAGSYESYINNTTPGDHSPCATCLERGSAQLYRRPERVFKYLEMADPPIVEGLVVPFHAGETIGTIWVISHEEAGHFTGEDVRALTSLAEFAGATLAAQYINDALRARTRQLEQSQRTLQSHQDFAEQVVESSGDCIKVLDLDGRLLSMNTPGMKLMEIDDFSTCQNLVWMEFWEGPFGKAARAAVAAAKAGNVGSLEGPCRTAKGTPKWWHVQVTPISGVDGTPEKLLVVSRDVTDRRDAAKKLRDAFEAAEAANRNKDLFLAALSHELRTPLSPVILAVAAMQADQSLPPDARQYLQMIHRNVELEVRLIDDLLDVSRAVAGKLRLDTKRADVHGLLRFVDETCMSDANQKKISLLFRFDATADAVMVDAARLQQAFWNLLKNAIKFSGEGQTIEISTANPTPDTVEIRFKDQGIGIAPEAIPRLFMPFEQAETTTAQKFGGLGLGLAIAKAVVELHGGTIEAESAGLGTGASFAVRLPVTKTDPALIAPPVPAKTAPGTGSLRVLIVEDHVDTANVLAKLLKIAGYQVTTAGNAAAALAAAGSEPFDIIVSDLGLPDATGYDLMREIRQRHNLKGIAMTGYGMEEDFAKSRAAGFEAHVVKPINIEQLQKVIRRVTSIAAP